MILNLSRPTGKTTHVLQKTAALCRVELPPKTFPATRLTVDRQRHVPLRHSDSGHDGLAGVRPGVLLRHSFQLEGVAVAEHLQERKERREMNGCEKKNQGTCENVERTLGEARGTSLSLRRWEWGTLPSWILL